MGDLGIFDDISKPRKTIPPSETMGRITIFSLDECPHCKRAKSALEERDIPFAEINLSSYPGERTYLSYILL